MKENEKIKDEVLELIKEQYELETGDKNPRMIKGWPFYEFAKKHQTSIFE